MRPDATAGTASVLSFGPFCLCARERRLERDLKSVKIGSRALDILIALTDRAGEVVTKEQLTARVWPDTAIEESGLRVHVAGLRKALGDGRDGARYVTNIPGRGYSFVAPVVRSTPVAVQPLRAIDDVGHNLPCRIERGVGRDDAIRDISKQLLAKRFVSVVGPSGMAKTTVAVVVAHGSAPTGRPAADLVQVAVVRVIMDELERALREPGRHPQSCLRQQLADELETLARELRAAQRLAAGKGAPAGPA